MKLISLPKKLSFQKAKLSFVLFGIVVGAFFIRAYRVTFVPPSLSWDEVSIGYNAYSILKTGRDEHGRFLPLDAFVGYGDYKPPVAVYLTVPFVAIFGLSELAVRLPSVIGGTLAVLLTYFLVIELYKGYNNYKDYNRYIALLSALLLAISPWHLQLSRAGWEANIALTILLSGVLLVLRSREHPRLLTVCWIPFVLAMYTFNSARYVAPLLGLLFLFLVRRDMLAHKRFAVIGMAIALLSLAPLVPHLVSPEARLRFAEVNIFSDLSIVEKANERMAMDGGGLLANILHNRRVGFAIEYLKHFFDHFQPWFLFIRGDGNPKFSLQDVGQLYLIEAPFLIYGIYRLFTTDVKLAWTLIFWLIFAILPAAVARETPHALRIENSLPVWQIVIAYGIVTSLSLSSRPMSSPRVRFGEAGRDPEKEGWIPGQARNDNRRTNMLLTASLVGFLYLGSFSYFWHNYFNHYVKEYSSEWQYGYKQAVAEMQKFEGSYNNVVVSEAYGRSYMYTLFFTRTDPSSYLKSKKSTFDAAGFYHVFGFGKYRFPDRGIGSFDQNTLYIGLPVEAPGGARVLATINRPNGEPAFVIFDRP
ncbi:glycosyltransferase family 39 protein [Candidatus Gottesmanbacteria bacterium]|nr:glycosyltransferase family 39 protein [Candidatus Gottesmanbacteria bacterium]